MKVYMFRAVPLSIFRSLFTVHSAIVYVIQVFRQTNCPKYVEFHAKISLWNWCIWLVLLQRKYCQIFWVYGNMFRL